MPPTDADALFEFEDESHKGGLNALGRPERTWRVLVVDDDPDVHQATRFALDGVSVFGRRVEFLHAHSAAEARTRLFADKDLALVLLDVVMETDSAGLDLVDYIRNTVGLRTTRIVLRTGQPGYAPEHETILRYDINDYKTKSELTRHKLLTTITTAIRSYEQLCAMEANRRGLELIVRSSGTFLEDTGLQDFAAGVITQLAALLGTAAEGLVCAQGERQTGQYQVLAAAGHFASLINQPLEALPDERVRVLLTQALQTGQSVFAPGGVALHIGHKNGIDMAAFIDTDAEPGAMDRQLLDVFCANIDTLLRNRALLLRLSDYAYYDQLVGLPNRARFVEKIDECVTEQQQGWAIALVDIDDFSATNDVMGHRFGDLLLEAVARRLVDSLPGSAVIARVGGDTYGVLGAYDDIAPETVLACARAPLMIEGLPHKVSLTCGYVLLGQGPGAGVDLIKDASIALKRAKKDHKGHYLVFSDHMGAEARARALMLSELRSAFESERLYLVYQPQLDLATRQLVGLEALLRWRTEDGRFVPPDQFIPVAEHSGLITALGQWVLANACLTMRELLDQEMAPLRMAVNVSVVQLQDPAFPRYVAETLERFGLQGHHLELEITESVAVLPTQFIETTLRGFRAQGISIAIDDFGTGYSSLSYLERLPLDRIKIDRAFVRQLAEVKGPRIAEMVTQLGRKLGLQVLAEGIEDADVWLTLLSMGCHEGQGYHIAQPMDKPNLHNWLSRHQPAAPGRR